MTSPIRAFIVDDSTLARVTLHQILGRDPSIEVVGEARSGAEALRKVPSARPDIVLMDMVMPGMDGLQTTRELMATFPRPILIVSDLVGRDANLNFDALAAGALDLVRKPTAADRDRPETVEAFVRRIRLLAGVPVITRHRSRARPPSESPSPVSSPPPDRPPVGRGRLLVLGASTGGPIALHQLLTGIGEPFACPVLIVQHMTRGFTEGMARWLEEALRSPVRLARSGVVPEVGSVYLAPEDVHLTLRAGRLHLVEATGPAGHCPSVDVLFESVAKTELAPHTAAALLTGMGDDGARGLLALRRAGAWTIAQDQATSVVYGMPRAAVAMGAAREELPLLRIAERLAQICGASARRGVVA